METKWNLELLYKNISDKQIEKDIEQSQKKVLTFVKKWEKNKEYLSNFQVLFKALSEYELLMEDPGICTKPSYYIFLNRVLNQEDPQFKARENKLHEICLKLENSIQFFTLNISKIPKEKQIVFLQDPLLKKYKHFLQTLFNISKYILSDAQEKVFNIKSKTSHSNWVNMLSELLSKQELSVIDEKDNKKKITYNEISKYLDSKERRVREYAAKEFYKVNKRYEEIAEFEINSVLENKKINDIYRKIPKPETVRLLSDDMQESVVETLRDVVSAHFDIPQRFYTLKAKLLNQKSLAYFERNVLLDDMEREYSFEQSFKTISDTFCKLDREFSNIVTKYLSEGRYDVYPKKGKGGGAFCTSVGSKYPTYILLNHNGKLQDVLTLAHESGHGIHTEYSNTQNVLNQGYSTACAEVASTFFENFTLEHLSDSISKKEKYLLIAKSLEEDISTVFRQIACYNFELKLHEEYSKRGFLSTKEISSLFVEEMSKYLGKSVLPDIHMQVGWIYWSHIREFFYTYSYASGLLISKYLQRMVKENPKDIEKVKNFFKAGDSKSPNEIFLDLGIDISKREFWEESILEINKKLEYLEKENLLMC